MAGPRCSICTTPAAVVGIVTIPRFVMRRTSPSLRDRVDCNPAVRIRPVTGARRAARCCSRAGGGRAANDREMRVLKPVQRASLGAASPHSRILCRPANGRRPGQTEGRRQCGETTAEHPSRDAMLRAMGNCCLQPCCCLQMQQATIDSTAAGLPPESETAALRSRGAR
ncbi:hypothetical protein BDV96DRAFT_600936 [Lophiotrema nucula]|uniref:Uncharacterized protein n=1 Tax=Lophiotrema nucula TaxID=690887 RepID=A0A6A5Z742_9PLEO|nr:hypothetical protein BDV96DRAFT_600936 [Lophiotrema nucula]